MLYPAVALGLRFALSTILQEQVPFLLFFPAVLLTAYAGGLRPGLFATGVSVVLSGYFLIEPTFSLGIADPNWYFRLALFALVCAAISAVCGRLRDAQRTAEANAREAETAKLLSMELLAREKAAREEVERASRLKDEFLATVSHELRTPLNPIVGWARMLRAEPGDPAKLAHGLDVIERNTVSLNQLIEDLLDVSRAEAGKMRLAVGRADLARVVESAVEPVRLAADAKGIRIEIAVAPDVGAVSGDPDRLQQVVWNLLSNAVKFTPDGGLVRVEARRVDGSVEIVVSDTGKGIEPEFLPHVFERFRQADSSTKREHGGLGLGLAIVHHLVELHGGTVEAASDGVNRGARFTVRLPAGSNVERAAAAKGRAAPGPTGALAGLRVLVVDDNDDTRDLIALVLSGHGAKVEAVGSADEAIGAVRASRPHVLVSDIGMPGRDGYELVAELRAVVAEHGLPAIALTAYARAEDRAQALAAGFDMHLAKPVDPDALVAAIAALAAAEEQRRE